MFFHLGFEPYPELYRPLADNGELVLPSDFLLLLRKRGLHLPCFCAALSGVSVSCRIIEDGDGTVRAFCKEYPPKCSFYGMLVVI